MNSTTLLAISAITVAIVMISSSAQADAAMSSFSHWPIFVHIDGVRGDVTTQGYDNGEWFVADSFSFGVEREMKESGEKGGTQDINIGVGELQDVTISKSMDVASASLTQFALSGNSCGTAEIDFVEIGGFVGAEPVTYLKYKLDRCFVKSWTTSGDADDRPTEEVTFVYNKIAYAYKDNADELKNPDQGASWDVFGKSPWDAVLGLLDALFPEEPTCEEECNARANDVFNACIDAGEPLDVCQRQAGDALAACLATCEA